MKSRAPGSSASIQAASEGDLRGRLRRAGRTRRPHRRRPTLH
ncbi:hypothetical protein HMPREF0043_02263, partial [Actinobaculum sp. oral taxon 183 str. F0552]